MRRVIVESPYASRGAASVAEHIAYARRCVRDSVLQGEAPIASHLLFTQEGILNDADAGERRLGIDAGHAWLCVADAVVVYTDLGVSPGMYQGVQRAEIAKVPVEWRQLGEDVLREILPELAQSVYGVDEGQRVT